MNTRRANAGLFLMIVVLSGCGESVPPPPKFDLVPVSGTIKLGGAPTAGIQVTFFPIDATKGAGATGTTDDAGKYELEYITDQEPGIPAGKYGVKISKFAAGASAELPPGFAPAGGGKNLIPKEWNEINPVTGQPGHIVTVPAGGSTFDFDIPAN